MKRFILILSAVFLLTCCDRAPFVGYVVCKEYVPEHMSNEDVEIHTYASFIPVSPHVVITTRQVAPSKIESKWILYVANKHQLRPFDVDSLFFNKVICGQKVIIKRK